MSELNLSELLSELRRLGVTITAQDGQLSVRAPKGAMTEALQRAIRARKSELVALLDPALAAPDDGPPLTRLEDGGAAPLSHAQEGIWLHQQVQPDSTAFNILARLRISGPLDVSRLQSALRAVIERHTPLHSRFVEEGGEPQMRVAEVPAEPVRVIEAEAWQDPAYRAFDLANDLPIRALLYSTGHDEHELIVVVHHIAVDGTSIQLLFRDLLFHYEGRSLPDLPVRYSDYAVWDRERWSGDRLRDGVEEWCSELQDAPPPPDVPRDRPHDAGTRGSAGAVQTRLSAEEFEGLQSVLREEHATPFMAMLTAYAFALHRQTGDRDFVIATPVNGRTRTELQELIGMFVNPVAMRIRIERGDTFRTLLRRSKEVATAAFGHAEVPYGRVVRELESRDGSSGAPLTNVFLNVLPFRTDSSVEKVGELTVEFPSGSEFLDTFGGQANTDFTLYAGHSGTGFRIDLRYDASLYSPDRVEYMVEDIRRALQTGAESPDEPIHSWISFPPIESPDVPLLNETDDAYVLDAVRRVAETSPDSPAWIANGTSMSYAELWECVEAVAERILTSAPPGAVGVLVSHEDTSAVALLGVMASGRPYVPLDPAFPTDRLRFMRDDAEMGCVLVGEGLQEKATELFGHDMVRIPLHGDRPDASAALPTVADRDIAYLLYTSGSSGAPKAVVQTHGNLLRQIRRYARALDLCPDDRVALLSSISFDASLMDLYGALCHGAAVCPYDLRARDLAEFASVANDVGLTVLHTTPTVFSTLAQASGTPFHTVRAVDLGGERLSRLEVRAFDELFPSDAVLYNSYGPSEHTLALIAQVDRKRHERTVHVPIGRPVDDVQVRLIGEDGAEDPVCGELTLVSRYGSVGYWRRDELTAAAFGAEPGEDGTRSYRTGDRARRDPDGQYYFVGRVDHQLKVRGYRIEPTEVESVIAGHVDVGEVAVHGPTDGEGRVRLTACVVPGREDPPDFPRLADWCRRHLPEFMVPTEWITLDALPRTPTGKLDRRSLPAATSSDEGRSRAVARDAIEAQLIEVWSEVLGRHPIGVRENFFELGGHSLAVIRVAARIRDLFDVELPLRQLFDFPTIVETAEWIRSQSGRDSVLPPIVPGEFPDGAPLSFSQERMWFLQEISPADTAYNLTAGVELIGPFDVDRYERAVTAVLERHEVLRSVFPVMDGNPVQRLRDDASFSLIRLSLDGEAEDDRFEEARRKISELLFLPYDLERDLPIRVIVARVSRDRHVVGVGMHHIVADLVSYFVFGREVAAFYREDLASAAAEPLTVQYADFSAWQRDRLSEGHLQASLDYWCDRLAELPALELPTDRVRPTFFSSRGAGCDASLSPELRVRLRSFANEMKASGFMVHLAAFNALLYTLSGQVDLSVGCPVAHRTQAELERLIGTFVNTLVHRNDISGDPSFRELVARIRSTALEAFEHQDVPFELLVRTLNPERDTSRSPLFQVLFNYGDVADDIATIEGLDSTIMSLDRISAQFDVRLNVVSLPQEMRVELTYCADLFEAKTAERMLERYVALLERAVTDPDLPLSELVRVLDRERDTLLVEWNDTAREEVAWASVPDAVAVWATRAPDRRAVEQEGESRTYAELVHRAREIAGGLADLGVQSGDRVGILLGREIETIPTLLAVLGLGATYVPIDPSYPERRVRYVLDDCGAAALVTRGALGIDTGGEVAVLDLDDWTAVEVADFVSVDPDESAYVIYTSGSTGKPKGVEIPHGAMVNFLRSMTHTPGLTEADRLFAVTTISFDISVLEMFLPLIEGASVIFGTSEESADPALLARRLDETGATVMQATPATWKALLSAGWQGRTELRAFCGGEPMPPAFREELLPNVSELWNLYGPTETTVWSTVQRVSPDEEITIGRPIDHTSVYVLDATGHLAPIGVPGELCIGGRGVAKGYLGREDLTRERFVPDPFRPGERMYRTGDRARWRNDGQLEHLGRLDQQVKVRGFRIEVGEVEASLLTHSDVAAAAVAAVGDRLVAYLVFADPDRPTDTDELRRWVANELPPYMVPSVFVPMDALPLTPNGKLDRNALPDPKIGEMPAEQEAPANPIEERICEIWAECLEVERVGATDDFFRLGGHSLVATQVVARVNRAFEVDLTLRQFFEAPTVRQVAEHVAAFGSRPTEAIPSGRTEIPRVEPDVNVPISPAQLRIWTFQEFDPDSSVYNLTAAVHIEGPLDVGRLEGAIRGIVDDHEPLRTRLVREGGEVRLHVDPTPEEVLRIDDSGTHDLARRIQEEQGRPFRLAHEHPFRAVLGRDGDGAHHLVVTMHHVAIDGTGQMLFFEDLLSRMSATDSETRGDRSGEAAPPVRYSEYAAWEQQRWTGAVASEAVDFWKSHLDGAPDFLALPTDLPRSDSPTYSGGAVDGTIGTEALAEFRTYAQSNGYSPFMVLLAGFTAALHRASGESEIVIGAPVDGRSHPDTERMIGMFVNQLPVRLSVGGQLTFRELTQHARDRALAGMSHREFPFATLLEALDPPRDVRRTPVFQVMLNVMPPYEGPLVKEVDGIVFRAPDVEASSEAFDAQSKFDATLYARDRGDKIELHLAYNRDLFTPERMRGLLDDVLDVVRRGVRDPDSDVFAADVDSPEISRLVADDRAIEGSVVDRLESVVRSDPDRVAISVSGVDLTYRELWSAACGVAQEIEAEPKAGDDEPVGVFVPHGLEAVVAMWGVLLSGRPYLPLDPDYPAERLAFIRDEVNLRLVLAPEGSRQRCVDVLGPDVTVLTPGPEAGRADTPPPSRPTGDDTAYVLFTSGSTGRPKAVRQTHRNLLRQALRYRDALEIGSTDRVGLFASISFDASIMDIFGAGVSGATICPIDLRRTDLGLLPNTIEDRGISIVHLTPSVVRTLARTAPVAHYPTVRALVLGGEAVRTDDVAYFDRRFDREARIFNLYGSSEHSFSMGAFLDRKQHRRTSEIPIGAPMGDVEPILLDADGTPNPVVGELAIRSQVTAIGYGSGVPSADENVTLFRTGDIVRRDRDGRFIFLRRADDQLKVRGHRVEPAEIEAVLNRHATVESAAVHTLTDPRGDAVLAASVVRAPSAPALDVSELVRWCREHLPGSSVPNAWVELDSLPRTPSGKLDRRRLSGGEWTRSASTERVAPESEEECLIADVWEGVLGVDAVSISDNFFEIGGQSLSAIEVVDQIERRSGVRIDPRSLFFMSLRELGETIADRNRIGSEHAEEVDVVR